MNGDYNDLSERFAKTANVSVCVSIIIILCKEMVQCMVTQFTRNIFVPEFIIMVHGINIVVRLTILTYFYCLCTQNNYELRTCACKCIVILHVD